MASYYGPRCEVKGQRRSAYTVVVFEEGLSCNCNEGISNESTIRSHLG